MKSMSNKICRYCRHWCGEQKIRFENLYRKCEITRNFHSGNEPCSINSFEREPGSDDDLTPS